ncbi:MAG: GyrI-like domain-containing protein [Actinobacteria bacterium]|nr:GyrI-like domain-containing protein [Actinomycetota bacterium]
MPKIDLKKELKHLYKPSAKEVSLVDVPSMNFLMADGTGNPNASEDFQPIIEALYGVSFTLKFMVKKETPDADWVVQPLEGLWWAEDMTAFTESKKDLWLWTLMIAQPDIVTEHQVKAATYDLERKKNPPALSKVRFERYHEGLAVQIMHIGPYSEEGPNIRRLHEHARENGYALTGKHHEIYLSDPRKCAPEKLKTIIRQPVEKE